MRDGVEQRSLSLFAVPERFRLACPIEWLRQLAVSAFNLDSARLLLLRPVARPRRRLSDRDCGSHKYHECDPVLWLGDGKRVDRRDEEIVETEHAEKRGNQRRAAAPGDGGDGYH